MLRPDDDTWNRLRDGPQVQARGLIRYCAAVAGGRTTRSRVASRWSTRANPCSTLRKRSSIWSNRVSNPVEPVLEPVLEPGCGRGDRVSQIAVRRSFRGFSPGLIEASSWPTLFSKNWERSFRGFSPGLIEARCRRSRRACPWPSFRGFSLGLIEANRPIRDRPIQHRSFRGFSPGLIEARWRPKAGGAASVVPGVFPRPH